MAAHFPILQIVGYQNSGKTTFVEKLAEKLGQLGVKIGCLKHHGHGGEPDVFAEGKDSDRFFGLERLRPASKEQAFFS